MDVAVATGRGVLEVARQSYALTLYTHWHIEQRRRLTLILQKSERLDLAGLMARAYHEPKSLLTEHEAFIAGLRAPASVGDVDVSLARRLSVIRAAHAASDVVTLIPS